MQKTTKQILLGAGAAVTGAGLLSAASYSISKKLMKLALDREAPEAMSRNREKLKGSKEVADYMEALSAGAERLKNSEYEDVTTTSEDGLCLKGHWRTCEDPKRVIVAMHGWRSSWNKDFGAIADFWHDNGCDVLYAEQRGQGESEGDYMGFGLLERYDCRSWVEWVNRKTEGKLPIYLGGVSMGATTVLMAAGLELPANVRGILADCGFTSPHAIWKHVVENNPHIPYRLHEAAMSDLCRKKIQVSDDEYSTLDAMETCTVPVLFIHGTEDKFVPIEMTYENYKACSAPKQLVVVPGAGHGMSYFMDQGRYESALKTFWKENDHGVSDSSGMDEWKEWGNQDA